MTIRSLRNLTAGGMTLVFLPLGVIASSLSEPVNVSDDAISSTEETELRSTWEEARKLYEQARETGETATESVYEWVREDLNRFGQWQYRLETLDSKNLADCEQMLNDLGRERWECFHIESLRANEGEMLFFFKRPVRSYLRNLSIPNLLRYLPGTSSEDQEESPNPPN